MELPLDVTLHQLRQTMKIKMICTALFHQQAQLGLAGPYQKFPTSVLAS